jgi:hypothetical protein
VYSFGSSDLGDNARLGFCAGAIGGGAGIAGTGTNGYWLATSDGHIFQYGDARYIGDIHSMSISGLQAPWIALVTRPR